MWRLHSRCTTHRPHPYMWHRPLPWCTDPRPCITARHAATTAKTTTVVTVAAMGTAMAMVTTVK